ncbi:triphosphoribosyl-dephospho-CoA synthase [Methylosinus sp. C49]|jgi:triphosphoribosyl-dephospho-CoA synthase|uniref:triphosphoribosyl-dephospho-CoA synthase n=1 Tax=Methylosinus sp. C49 TaxID=2699395 RepID=UPI00136732D3|nr:triphosphoribosyl-dephospho-CoA synthase [Methylosinus sp. C49]BBU61272.1 triphosphoribosyl-dephospho-CoA synthase [Methylosinus sp. C49]
MAEPLSEQIARAFIAACENELAAPKPGNVHIYAPGHGMEAQDFIASAAAAAPHLAATGASVGTRILGAVEATWARVGCNTNLGIILLCAPIAHAALREGEEGLAEKLAATLKSLDSADADLAFRAIMRASPAGLGSAPQHDVAAPAQISLGDAMALAADRDLVARQYANGFADIFGLGQEAIRGARARGHDRETVTLLLFMTYARLFADTHIQRKFGEKVALETLTRFQEAASLLDAAQDRDSMFHIALELDHSLKKSGYNPGACADLTVAALFVDYLLAILPNVHKNG